MKSLPRSAPVFYPVAEQLPDSKTHQRTRNELVETVTRHLAALNVVAFTSSDQFMYWVEGDASVSIAPDLYVVLGAEPSLLPDIWRTWESGVPDLVIEVVSKNRKKDYDLAPLRYAEMGVRELVVFDPYEMRNRVRWQHFQRRNDSLERCAAHNGARVWSGVLGAWLVQTRFHDGTATVRVATGPDGEHLVPTDLELAEQAQAERDAAHAERDAAHAERDEARAALLAAQAELESLKRALGGD